MSKLVNSCIVLGCPRRVVFSLRYFHAVLPRRLFCQKHNPFPHALETRRVSCESYLRQWNWYMFSGFFSFAPPPPGKHGEERQGAPPSKPSA